MQKSGLKNKYKAGEMARWIKHFLGKSEDVSSNLGIVGYTCIPGVLQQNGPCASTNKKDPVCNTVEDGGQ